MKLLTSSGSGGSGSSGGRRMRGGSFMDGNWNMEDIKKIFKPSSYQYLFSMLLVISCIFLVFATIIFVNACINLHKTSFHYPKGDDYRKLIDAPIFEYLKTSNFLVIDKFLLNADSSLKPSSIAFWTVIGIMLGVLIFLGIHHYILSKNEEIKNYLAGLMEIMIPYLLIAAFPYIFIFIIVIFFNSIQVKNNNDLYNLKIKEIKKYRKDKLPEIKKELQKILYENDPKLTEAFEESFKDYLYIDIPQATTGALASTTSANCSGSANGANAGGAATAGAAAANAATASINIDIVAIVFIYKHNLKVLKKSGDQLKQYQRKYINYIDEYFDLLNRSVSGSGGSGEDNYTKFYLFGLIEYKDGDNEDFSGRIKEYRDIIKATNGGEDGDGLEKLLIKQITSNLSAYFITVISLYTIFAVAAIVLLLIYNDNVKMPFIYTLIMIGKVVSLQSFLIIITVLLVLIGLFALLFIVVFPQIYNLTYALSARMF
jgi:hypothetical protein